LFSGLFACKESERFEIGYSDSVPPAPPEFLRYDTLYGGARIYFTPPRDRDLLSVDASYISESGEKRWFSVSYYISVINVYGFGTEEPRTVQLYAVDRAGNKSEAVDILITPYEPAVTQVAGTVYVKPGFSSFYVDWKNVLEQNMNIYVDYTYTEQGVTKEKHVIYTSNDPEERRFVRGFELLTSEDKIHVSIRVDDKYGNMTEILDMGEITLLEDEKVPKDRWSMPSLGDSIGGVPQAFLAGIYGRDYKLYDDIIDDGRNFNMSHTMNKGRTGNPADGNMPWNVMIDLGDYYELSRIITHQRYNPWSDYITDLDNFGRGAYYGGENVGMYAMYIWNDEVQVWDSLITHKITYPVGSTDRDLKLLGKSGDLAYMYPDDPQFTRPTRWFRYEALGAFGGNYTSMDGHCLSEITLYAKKK
jgi:hypothetical protein